MPNPISIVVDHYFDITGQEPENYARHVKPAKELLILCDGDPERAKEILDKVNSKLIGFDWSIYQAVKRYIELKSYPQVEDIRPIDKA